MPANTLASAPQFTGFTVSRCIRVNYDGETVHHSVHSTQDQALLAALSLGQSMTQDGKRHSLIHVEAEGDSGLIIASEDSEAYHTAIEADDDSISLCSGSFAGIHWRILAFVEGSSRVEDAYQLAVGECEETIRHMCAGLQSLVELPKAMRAYNNRLDKEEKAPEGEDYNALLTLAGI